MDLNYAIFRSEPIYTLNDLAQIGSHNKREKKTYNSNKNIKIELSKDNIELIPLTEKYVKGFYNLTQEYRKQHDEKQKTERDSRKRTFNQMVNLSKNVVADELLFTASHNFFKDMSREDIKRWADVCMEFVYKDLGYKKEQVLHSVVHLDEDTPHIHCVVVPLVKKFDKRTKTERYTISKKQYIRDKLHISELQDKYHERLISNGFDLERGIKGNDVEHQNMKQFKKTTRYYENKVQTLNKKLDDAVNEFEEKMKTTKNLVLDKDYVKVKKDTFESMNKVINETKKIVEFEPKIEQLFNEVNSFTKSHQTLEKENKNLKKEIKSLTTRNQNLTRENDNLKTYLNAIIMAIKKFFRKLLQINNEPTKQTTTNEIKEYYDNNVLKSKDVYDIAKETTKEDELFEYADIPDYLKTNKDEYKVKQDYDIER